MSAAEQAFASPLQRAGGGSLRFRVTPAGRRFGWQGTVCASDRRTGLLEVCDPGFAKALRRRAERDTIEELP